MFRKIPSQEFLSKFSPELCAQWVAALDTAYNEAAEHHYPDRGDNALTFGVRVYAYACKRLGGIAEDDDNGISIQKGPSFRLRLSDGYEVGCHKVGNTAQQDIWSSFPGNRGGVRTLIEEQIPFPIFKPEEVQGKKFVLAHTGNPDDGLCAVYICQAKRLDHNGQICEWEFVHQVWKRDTDRIQHELRKADRIPEERVDEPVLKRKPRKEQESNYE